MKNANEQMLNRGCFLKYVGAGACAGVGRVVVAATAQATITSASWVHSMKQHLCALATALLLTVPLGGTHAFASDAKNYAGATCQPFFPADHSIAYYSGGQVRNISDTWALWVSCPIINDHDTGISDVSIGVDDRHQGDSVFCWLISWWVEDTRRAAEPLRLVSAFSKMYSSIRETPSGILPGIEVLMDAHVSLPRGDYYELRCSVPPRLNDVTSGILFYRVSETPGPVPY
jgi:hypothetical protein